MIKALEINLNTQLAIVKIMVITFNLTTEYLNYQFLSLTGQNLFLHIITIFSLWEQVQTFKYCVRRAAALQKFPPSPDRWHCVVPSETSLLFDDA